MSPFLGLGLLVFQTEKKPAPIIPRGPCEDPRLASMVRTVTVPKSVSSVLFAEPRIPHLKRKVLKAKQRIRSGREGGQRVVWEKERSGWCTERGHKGARTSSPWNWGLTIE